MRVRGDSGALSNPTNSVVSVPSKTARRDQYVTRDRGQRTPMRRVCPRVSTCPRLSPLSTQGPANTNAEGCVHASPTRLHPGGVCPRLSVHASPPTPEGCVHASPPSTPNLRAEGVSTRLRTKGCVHASTHVGCAPSSPVGLAHSRWNAADQPQPSLQVGAGQRRQSRGFGLHGRSSPGPSALATHSEPCISRLLPETLQ